MKKNIVESFSTAFRLLEDFINNEEAIEKVNLASQKLAEIFLNGNKVIIAGNGGSACDAMHFAEEFTGRFRKDRRPLPVISLTDSSHITCVANDYGFDKIFQRGLTAYSQQGDVFIGLSTSGNSKNIINAVKQAKQDKLFTILLLGKEGGALKGIADIEWIIPGKTSDRIQEIHMLILHIMIEGVERIMFPSNYND